MYQNLVRVAAAVPLVKVADCKVNSERILGLIRQADSAGVETVSYGIYLCRPFPKFVVCCPSRAGIGFFTFADRRFKHSIHSRSARGGRQ